MPALDAEGPYDAHRKVSHAEQAAEHTRQTAGHICFCGGLAVGVGTVLGAVWWWSTHDNLTSIHAHLLPLIVVLALLGVALVAVTVGALEWLTRPQREGVLNGVSRVREIEREHAVIADRLQRIEQALAKIPDYGAGVIDGIQMRQTVVRESAD